MNPDDPAPGAGPERWSRLRGSHELYNAGHLYEAAVAYYQATGKKKLLDLDLPMPIRRVTAHDGVQYNRGKVALERGPIVYCAEWADNGGQVLDLVLPDEVELAQELEADLLDGVVVVRGKAVRLANGESVNYDFVAIPYHVWANRGEGEMTVWIPRSGETTQGES